MISPYPIKRSNIGILVGLIAVWAALYLPGLRTVPGWYGDETIALDVGINLVNGHFAAAGLWNTFGTYIYQPFYALLLGVGWLATGHDILGARFINALMALAVALVLWLQGQKVVGRSASLAAALLFLGYDQSILHFRQCFAHNSVALGTTLAILAVCQPSSRRSNWAAGMGLLFCVGAHPMGIYSSAVTGLARLKRPLSWPSILLPGVLVCGLFYWFIYQRFGMWLWEDIMIVIREHNNIQTANQNNFSLNVWRFVTQDSFHLWGFVGVFWMLLGRRNYRRWPIPAVVTVFVITLLSNRSNLTLFYYQAVVFLPWLALGCGFLIHRLLQILQGILHRRSQDRALRWPARYAGPALGCLLIGSSLVVLAQGKLIPRNQTWVSQSPEEIEAAARWLNANTSPEDIVLCNTNIAWLLQCRHASLLQYTAWKGLRTFMHEHTPKRERFRHNLESEKIKYLVVGDIDSIWTLHQENVMNALKDSGMDRWPVIWQGKHYSIFANPQMESKPQTPR